MSVPRRGPRGAEDRVRRLLVMLPWLMEQAEVSVAETAHQDLWNRAELTVAFVTSDGVEADRMASHLDTFVEEWGRAQILNVRSETF